MVETRYCGGLHRKCCVSFKVSTGRHDR